MKTAGWSKFPVFVLQSLIVFLGYVAVGELGSWLTPTRPWGVPLWLPAGFALFAATYWGARVWPALFLAALFISPFKQTTWIVWFGTSLADSAQALFGAWIVTQFLNGRKALETPAGVLKFIFLATPWISVIGTTLTTSVLVFEFSGTPERLGSVWFSGWISNAVGILAMAPALFYSNFENKRVSFKRLGEWGIVVLLLLAATTFLSLSRLPFQNPEWVLALIVVPMAALVALRNGPWENSLFLFAAVNAFFFTASGKESMVPLQWFCTVFAATVLWVSSYAWKLRGEIRYFESQLHGFRNTILDLQENREKNRQIMEGSLDAIITLDQDEAITGYNQRSQKLFGWRRQEILGRRFVDTIIPKRYRELFRQGVERCLIPGDGLKPSRKVEIKLLHRDGSEFPAEVNAVNFTQQGEVQMALFLRDISDRWKAEENMRVHLAEIERLNENLSRQKDELDVYQNVVTNEIANFCAALQSSVEVMLHYLEETPTPAQEELLFRCQRQIFEMNRLTENIHLLHHLRQNAIVPIHDTIRLQRALMRSVDTVRSIHFDKDFEVTVDCPESIVISQIPYLDALLLSVLDEAVRGVRHKDIPTLSIRGSEDDGKINISLRRTPSDSSRKEVSPSPGHPVHVSVSSLHMMFVQEFLKTFGGGIERHSEAGTERDSFSVDLWFPGGVYGNGIGHRG